MDSVKNIISSKHLDLDESINLIMNEAFGGEPEKRALLDRLLHKISDSDSFTDKFRSSLRSKHLSEVSDKKALLNRNGNINLGHESLDLVARLSGTLGTYSITVGGDSLGIYNKSKVVNILTDINDLGSILGR